MNIYLLFSSLPTHVAKLKLIWNGKTEISATYQAITIKEKKSRDSSLDLSLNKGEIDIFAKVLDSPRSWRI